MEEWKEGRKGGREGGREESGVTEGVKGEGGKEGRKAYRITDKRIDTSTGHMWFANFLFEPSDIINSDNLFLFDERRQQGTSANN